MYSSYNTLFLTAASSHEPRSTKGSIPFEKNTASEVNLCQNATGTTTLPKKSLFYRLALDGFADYKKSKSVAEKLMWLLSIISMYTCGIYLSIITFNRYLESGRVVDVQEHQEPSFRFPDVMICLPSFYNRTFFHENVEIPGTVLSEFEKRLMGKEEIIQEFSRYLKYYNPASANSAGDFEVWKWDLLTEIFNHNFRHQDFSGFVSDAAFRRDSVLKKCEFEGRRYRCVQMPFVIDTPSCYIVLVEGKRTIAKATLNGTANIKGLSFEVSLPTKDTFFEFHNNDDYETLEMGAYMYLSASASPFQNMLTFPGNTHAMVELQSAESRLTSSCYSTPPVLEERGSSIPFYSQDACMFEIFQNQTHNICDCIMIGGIYYPPNSKICTPTRVKECVLKKRSDINSGYSPFLRHNGFCKPLCNDYEFWSSLSYYDMERDNDEHTTNRFTIFYSSKRQFLHIERSSYNWYEVSSNIGGLIGVYTGASVAAVAQAFFLLAVAGWKRMCFKACKTILSPSYLPLVSHKGIRIDDKGKVMKAMHRCTATVEPIK